MRDAVDLGPGARGSGVRREAEQRQYAIYVHEQQRPGA
jgi:hypothetical protein